MAPLAPLHAADTDALAAIDACTARLDAQLDVGYERIAARCPDLARTLEQSGLAAWLPQGWKESQNDLSAGSLRELRTVATRELATRAAAREPSVARLKEILAGLGDAGQQRGGAWARFRKWLRAVFERGGQQQNETWLSRMVARVGISDAAVEVITYIALGGVIALAGFIVFNELRVAGLLGARRREEPGSDGGSAALALRTRPTWSDVERAALLDQPRLLLEMIAAKLTDLKRLPPAGAFTVRELTRAADLWEDLDRSNLTELALTAERARYADGGVSPAVVEAAVGHGRELLTRLESREAETPQARGSSTDAGNGTGVAGAGA
ncbi:MAG TPA: hypothetical protein VGO53_14845 [Steroidobacteraceae bacterium]|nr:hypothetical protein [Steroidobacteraceae bacterium]